MKIHYIFNEDLIKFIWNLGDTYKGVDFFFSLIIELRGVQQKKEKIVNYVWFSIYISCMNLNLFVYLFVCVSTVGENIIANTILDFLIAPCKVIALNLLCFIYDTSALPFFLIALSKVIALPIIAIAKVVALSRS